MNKAIITQLEIERVVILREKHADLKKRLAELDKEVSASEVELIKKMKAGANNESPFLLKLKTTQKRSVQWKEWFVRKVGKLAADRILSKTKPSTYVEPVIGAADVKKQKAAA